MAYEDSELNGNVEDKLVTWGSSYSIWRKNTHEHGKPVI